MKDLFTLFSFLFGSLIGSFSNVCIYRLPREESIVFPPSHCPHCKEKIKPYFNIPVIGFLILRGRCHSCSKPISLRYPFVELLTALTYLFLFRIYGLTPIFFIYSLFFSSLIIITMIDLEHTIIPDVITLPGIIIGLISSFVFLPNSLSNSFAGILLGGGIFYFIAVASGGGMGGGDIKLIAMIGAFLGWEKTLLTIFISALLGSVAGIILILFMGKNRKDMIPYGPFIALGAAISHFWGRDIIILYLGFIKG